MSTIEKSPVARSIPFDSSTNGFISTDVQGAIEEIGASASPGFSFSRSGVTAAGTYLQVDAVPSNQAGRIVPLTSGMVTDAFVSCQTAATFTIEFQKRVGTTFTTFLTITVTNARKLTQSLTGVPVALGDEICARVGSGTVSNVVVGIILRGAT
jgi:hypothetical protein